MCRESFSGYLLYTEANDVGSINIGWLLFVISQMYNLEFCASNEVTPSAWINVMLTKNKSVIMAIYGKFFLPYSRYGLLTVSDWVSCRECIFCIVINRPIKGRNKTTKGITIVIVISVYCAQILDLDLSQSTCTWYSRKKYTYFFL